jgi:hypothetical protein
MPQYVAAPRVWCTTVIVRQYLSTRYTERLAHAGTESLPLDLTVWVPFTRKQCIIETLGLYDESVKRLSCKRRTLGHFHPLARERLLISEIHERVL